MPFLARWKGMKEKGFHSFIERKKNLGPSEPEGGGGTCPPDFGSFTSAPPPHKEKTLRAPQIFGPFPGTKIYDGTNFLLRIHCVQK